MLDGSTDFFCACRPGFKADAKDKDVDTHWRVAWKIGGHEHRVFVRPGVTCNTVCSSKSTSRDLCNEVALADLAQCAAPQPLPSSTSATDATFSIASTETSTPADVVPTVETAVTGSTAIEPETTVPTEISTPVSSTQSHSPTVEVTTNVPSTSIVIETEATTVAVTTATMTASATVETFPPVPTVNSYCDVCSDIAESVRACHPSTICVFTPLSRYCACRAGYKASDDNWDVSNQWRFILSEYSGSQPSEEDLAFIDRVFVSPGRSCEVLCDRPGCAEVIGSICGVNP
ncbi:hypothetical protein BC832DRAFT_560969 [Gaertneriomyces semiglobifer]|nr:hypothetical protein BC832DRAFT_560969 [Gaertneriomyces semiglobifer]